MNSNDPIEQWRREEEIRAAQPWPVFKRRAYRVFRIVFLWLALGLFFQVVGVEENDSVNPEFEKWFLFVAMGVSCLFAGHAFSDDMEEIKAAPLPEQAVRLIGALMVGAFFAGLIFFAALLGALAWELIL